MAHIQPGRWAEAINSVWCCPHPPSLIGTCTPHQHVLLTVDSPPRTSERSEATVKTENSESHTQNFIYQFTCRYFHCDLLLVLSLCTISPTPYGTTRTYAYFCLIKIHQTESMQIKTLQVEACEWVNTRSTRIRHDSPGGCSIYHFLLFYFT